MSSTLILSAHPSLWLSPWASKSIDKNGISDVLARHGLGLLDLSRLESEIETTLHGLDLESAQNLATDLRDVGVHVRVVDDPNIVRSARIGWTMSMMFLVALLTFPLVIPALLALFNAIFLASRTNRLIALGSPSTASSVVSQIEALAEHLPEHLVTPLLERTRRLELAAQRDPNGAAARGLNGILSDLKEAREDEHERESASLRRDLQRAQRAASEVR